MINKNKMFELLRKLAFVRYSGTKEEYDAMNILKDEVISYCDDVEVDEFEVDYNEIKEATLEIVEPINKNFVVKGILGCGNHDITKEFKYVQNIDDADLLDVKDKIVLINATYLRKKTYEKLVKANVSGIIAIDTSLYNRNEELKLIELRKECKDIKILPCVLMKTSDAETLVKINPKLVHIKINQYEGKALSHNLIVTIKGQIDETICYSAHYDSVYTSQGVYDNASGCVGLVELIKYFSENKPYRTLKFIFMGSEEIGLKGSLHYCEKYPLNDHVLNINLDMIGVTLGYDIACISASNNFVSYTDYFAKINGFPINVYAGVYSSDSTPFADKGVPSMSFARLSNGLGKQIHSTKDDLRFMSKDKMKDTLNFIILFSETLINAKVFPIKKEIDNTIKDQLDIYFKRK